MINSGKYVLQTERLILTEFNFEIADNFFQLNADSEVLRYTGDEPFDNVEEAKHFLEGYDQYERYGYGRWSIWKKGTSKWLGWCGLRNNGDDEIDLGFRLHRKYWNMGYGTEAATACLRYGFSELKIEEIIARANADNLASLKIIKKLSLQYWKTEFDTYMGETVYFRLDASQYRKLNQI